MATEAKRLHFKAVRMLAGATLFWCISFPIVKGLLIIQEGVLPGSESWFQT